MGIRFNKRINLGKGIGINISKSGITPSVRTKAGSISSKGYSVRTGIPGITYRKTYSKAKNSGCLLVLLFFMLTSFFMFSQENMKVDNLQQEIKTFKNVICYREKEEPKYVTLNKTKININETKIRVPVE